MSSRREVLIRIALLQRKHVNWNKKSHIKKLKIALLDCAINEKCCSVDGGQGICPLVSSPPLGIWQLKSPQPREFAIQAKKKKLPPPGGGGGGLGAAGIDRMHYEGENFSDSSFHHIFESENFRFPFFFFMKNSLTWRVKCEIARLNFRKL